MKVFFLSAAEYLTDRDLNGEGLIAWNLLSALRQRGHEIVACVRYSSLSEPAPFEVIELGAGSRWESLSEVGFARLATAELRRRGANNFDIVHWLFPDGAFGLAPGQLPDSVPFVVGPLVIPWPAIKQWWPVGHLFYNCVRPPLLARQRRLFDIADQVLVAHAGVRQRLSEPVGARAAEIPFGITIRDLPEAELPLIPRVLFAGRLEESKGVVDLLDALAALRSGGVRCDAAFAGGGSLSDHMPELLRERGLGDGVELLGQITPDQVLTQMAASSLVCLPSHGEPFGMVLLEAMSVGRAVVAARSGGPASIVVDGKGGCLVDPGSPELLADALRELLSDRAALLNAGRFNRRRVEERYSLDAVVARLEAVYEVAAGAKRRSTGK